MWLVILIVVVLLLRAIATSKTAANVPMQTKTVCSSPTAGDSFTQGNTIAAGVPEPPPVLHCQHISTGPILYSGLPIHVVYPIAPPPIKITNPVAPAPAPISPKFLGPPVPIRSYPISPIRPLMSTCLCTLGTCGGGYGGGGGGSCSVVSHGELAGGDIGYF